MLREDRWVTSTGGQPKGPPLGSIRLRFCLLVLSSVAELPWGEGRMEEL